MRNIELDNIVSRYYKGELSAEDAGDAFFKNGLYSASSSYYMSAIQNSYETVDKVRNIYKCALSYWKQAKKVPEYWCHATTVHDLCQEALVLDPDNKGCLELMGLSKEMLNKDAKDIAVIYTELFLHHQAKCDDKARWLNKALHYYNINNHYNYLWFDSIRNFINDYGTHVKDVSLMRDIMIELLHNKQDDELLLNALKYFQYNTPEQQVMFHDIKSFYNEEDIIQKQYIPADYIEFTDKNHPISASWYYKEFYGITVSETYIPKWDLFRDKNKNIRLDLSLVDDFTSFLYNCNNADIGIMFVDKDNFYDILKSINFNDVNIHNIFVRNQTNDESLEYLIQNGYEVIGGGNDYTWLKKV